MPNNLNQGLQSIAKLLETDGNTTESSLQPPPDQGQQGYIALQTLSLTPNKVVEGETANLKAVLTNQGQKEATIYLGNEGRSLLKNYCPDVFTLESYQATLKSQTRGVKDVTSKQIDLRPEERLEAVWSFRAGQLPKPYSCQVELQRSYEYETSEQRQVQIKQSEDIKTAQVSKDSNKEGLVQIELETDRNSYLPQETIYLTVTLKNEGDGTADIREIAVNYPQLSGTCELPNPEAMVLMSGAKRQFRCLLRKQKLDVPSQMYRISARTRYKYEVKAAKALRIIK